MKLFSIEYVVKWWINSAFPSSLHFIRNFRFDTKNVSNDYRGKKINKCTRLIFISSFSQVNHAVDALNIKFTIYFSTKHKWRSIWIKIHFHWIIGTFFNVFVCFLNTHYMRIPLYFKLLFFYINERFNKQSNE